MNNFDEFQEIEKELNDRIDELENYNIKLEEKIGELDDELAEKI